MRPIEYIWMAVCVVTVLWWAGVATAAAAHLKDIRVGDHGEFTRVVFEFEEASPYHAPEIVGEGTASVVFPDSSVGAALPMKNMREHHRFIDSVDVVKKERNLVATIISRSHNFEVRSFSLVNPDRVVLDLYWSQEKPAAPTPVPEQPVRMIQSAQRGPEPVVSNEVVAEKPTATGGREPAVQTPPVPATVEPTALKEKRDEKPVPDAIETPVAFPRYDRVQMALMILLVALNLVTVAILAILTVVVLKWRRWSALSEREPVSDLLDNNVISIDSKIQEELKKYKRTR